MTDYTETQVARMTGIALRHLPTLVTVYRGSYRDAGFLSAEAATSALARAFYRCWNSRNIVTRILARSPLVTHNNLCVKLGEIVEDARPVKLSDIGQCILCYVTFNSYDIDKSKQLSIHIYNYIVVTSKTMTLSCIAQEIGRDRRNVYRALQTLVKDGLLVQKDDGQYALSGTSRQRVYSHKLLEEREGEQMTGRWFSSVRKYDAERVLYDLCHGEGVIRGNEYSVSCPNPSHHDDSPSFSYNLETDLYYCFGCGLKGKGVRSLLLQVTDIDERELGFAMFPYLVGNDGPRLLVQPIQEAQKKAKERRYANNLAMAQKLWEEGLAGYEAHERPKVATSWEPPHTEAQEYLLDTRNFSEATLLHFRIHVWYFHNTHPIYIPLQWNGDVWGFAQRRIHGMRMKYLTMDDVETSEHLFGESLPDVPFLLVEGQFDAMTAYQYGNRSFGAVLSNNFSEAQAKIIADCHPTALVVGADMDDGGQLLYERAVVRMRPYGIPVVRMFFSGKDINTISAAEYQLAWETVQAEIVALRKAS